MASSSKTVTAESLPSYTKMEGDLETIGAHCQLEYCGTMDFLPYKCLSCYKTFCLDHRSETNHKCANEGAWARRRTGIDTTTPATSAKPSLYTHDKQCGALTCKTILDARTPREHCERCRRDYCLKHRFGEQHDCDNERKRLIQTSSIDSQKEKGMAALKGLRAWANKKAAAANSASISIRQKAAPKPSSKGARIAAVNALKLSAKGDAKIPPEKRRYVFVEASADTTTAKFPTGKFFYGEDWSIGRVLDAAAKALQVQNVNNRVPGEEEKLRVFHVEKGELLDFSEKVSKVLENGDTIVLLRGVGPPVPELITL
jgi:predicted nucleic acid binding AN1-type Zn finger protein